MRGLYDSLLFLTHFHSATLLYVCFCHNMLLEGRIMTCCTVKDNWNYVNSF